MAPNKTGRTRTISCQGIAKLNPTWIHIGNVYQWFYIGPANPNAFYWFQGGNGFVVGGIVRLPFIMGGGDFRPALLNKAIYVTGGTTYSVGAILGNHTVEIADADFPSGGYRVDYEVSVTSSVTLILEEFEQLVEANGMWAYGEVVKEDAIISLNMSGTTWTETIPAGTIVPPNMQEAWGQTDILYAQTFGKFMAEDEDPPEEGVDSEYTVEEARAIGINNYYARNNSYGPAITECSLAWGGPGTKNATALSRNTEFGTFNINKSTCAASTPRVARAISSGVYYRPEQSCTVNVVHRRLTEREPTIASFRFMRGFQDNGPNNVVKLTNNQGNVSDTYNFGGSAINWATNKSTEPVDLRLGQTVVVTESGMERTESPLYNKVADNPLQPLAWVNRLEEDTEADNRLFTQAIYRSPKHVLGPRFAQLAEVIYEGSVERPFYLDNPATTGFDGWVTTKDFSNPDTLELEVDTNILRFRMVGEDRQYRIWSVKRFFNFAQPNRKLGYRHTRIRIRSVDAANQSLRFLIGGVGATITTGAENEWVEVDHDLFGDTQLTTTGTKFKNVTPQSGTTSNLEFASFPPNVIFEVEWIKGVRKHESFVRVWGLETLNNGQPLGQLLTGWTDGLQSLSTSLGTPTPGLPGQGATALVKLSTLVAAVNAYGIWSGWEASIDAYVPGTGTFETEFANPDNWAFHLCGFGLTSSPGSVASPQNWTIIPANGPLASQPKLPLTPVGARPSLYDGCGDVQNKGNYGLNIPIHFDIPTGLRLHGVVVGDVEEVKAKNVDDPASSAAGTVRESGYYHLDSPGIILIPDEQNGGGHYPAYEIDVDDINYIVQFPANYIEQESPYSFLGINTNREFFGVARYFYVRIYADPSTPKGIDVLGHPIMGYFAKVYGATQAGETQIWFRRTSVGVPDSPGKWLAKTKVVEGDGVSSPAVYLDPSSKLWVWWQDDTGAKRGFSNDDGLTWSEGEMAIPDGKQPQIGRPAANTPFPAIGAAWVEIADGVGVIKGQWLYPGSSTWGEIFTFKEVQGGSLVNLMVKDEGFDLMQMSEGMARWVLTAIPEGSTTQAEYFSADEGQSWTKAPA